MLGHSRHGNRIAAVIVLLLALRTCDALAGNTLSLKRSSDNMISLELSSSDAIAGFQFSINARGGITLQAYEATDQTKAAGLEIYQYLKNDTTLNVVMLAPYRASLQAGQCIVGKVSFTLNNTSGTDTVRLFLTGVVICDAAAQCLNVIATKLTWNPNTRNDAQVSPFALEQNFPNPFNPSTTITYKLERPMQVRLAVYDITGRLINTLIDQHQVEGRFSVRWNADDTRGCRVASGMYFARLQVGDKVVTQKMILTK
jgi:hypothetical protein